MIHQYKLNGYNIVLDTYSGGVHVVDDLTYDLIQHIDANKIDLTPQTGATLSIPDLRQVLSASHPEVTDAQIQESLADVTALVEAGQLFTEDSYEGVTLNLKDRKTEVKALCLNVAHTCNLDCEYCFASQGKYQGERALMSREVGLQAIDFLIANSGNHRNLDIDFFGGEPLMNLDVVKEIVEYARGKEEAHGKKFRFTFTTNGVLLDDENIKYLNETMDNIVLSLDGRKEVHDALRKTVNGKGSYDLIVPKFQQLVRERGDKEYYVRGTYTKNNIDFTEDVFHMADLGFDRLSMEPVIGDPSEPYALTEEDLPVLFEQYEILAKDMLRRQEEGHPIIFYHYMIDLSGGPCIYKRISGCGSGTEYLAVTPWGELFPCHQFVGDTRFSVGNVFDGVDNKTVVDDFKQCNCYARSACHDCWAKLYCSGGCAANALHATGDLTGTYPFSCALFEKRMECAIMLKVAEAMR